MSNPSSFGRLCIRIISPIVTSSIHIHNMSLKAGLYQVRFVPKHVQCPFKGGQYATSTTINAPIRAEPHHSGASDQTVSLYEP